MEIDSYIMKHILHISDIHFGTNNDADQYLVQLKNDLHNSLKIKSLDYLVISGDIGSYSEKNEYKAASKFVTSLSNTFRLSCDKVIIVPGNHDLNWRLAKNAYKYKYFDDFSEPLPEGKYIPAGEDGVLLRNEDLYKKRFDYFNEHFYQEIYGKPYAENYDEQGEIHTFPADQILFLALNSCWEIDHCKDHRQRSGINMNAFFKNLDKISNEDYTGWLKIATWHHPITGPEMMKNVDFLEPLVINGFQIVMHGHIHESQQDSYFYDNSKKIHTIGAGSFGVPADGQVPGIPHQYNLLKYNSKNQTIIVETRKKERKFGAWSADARWGDKSNNPEPRYTIYLGTPCSEGNRTHCHNGGVGKKTTIHLRSDPIEFLHSDYRSVYCLDENSRPLNYVPNKFIDNNNGTITDQATGLMWENPDSSRNMTYQQLDAFVRQFNDYTKLAGNSDWRLPTGEELMSILEPEIKSKLYLNPIFNGRTFKCWTADVAEDNTAVCGLFKAGIIQCCSRNFASSFRLVRTCKTIL